ncbi:transposase [Candidatus Gottesmanbacteria bacterium]|nr:transposase [Candidatus Gottesmanbacteria bacterium]MBI5452291.1 transposase [Candidatus Gottesmanbacteria bacterium]
MPGRNIPLVSGEYYHIFNKGVAGQPVFNGKRDYQRFLETMSYYQNKNPSVRYSKFLTLSVEERNKILESLSKQHNFIVKFISYCLMPNHFHLLLQQTENNGIAKFTSNLTNSYTRYFNVKSKRLGPLFQGKFKAVRIEDDEQLLHVTRYIHLNPYTSYVIKTFDELVDYPYSSLGEYLKLRKAGLVSKKQVLSHFKSLKSFKEFTLNQANYQRELQNIKHLILEK